MKTMETKKIGNNNVNSNHGDKAAPAVNKKQKPFEMAGRRTAEEIKKIAKNYKRIGTDYYLYATILTAKKEPVKILKRWRKTTIKEDYGTKVFR